MIDVRMPTNNEWLIILSLVIFEFFLFFMMYWNNGYKIVKCFIYAIANVVTLIILAVFGILLLHFASYFC
jgi:hypothetical protein